MSEDATGLCQSEVELVNRISRLFFIKAHISNKEASEQAGLRRL